IIMKKDVIELILQMNMTFYEQLAQDFSHTRQSAWQGWDDLLSHVRRKLANKKSISVLDIGCGNGRFAGYILGRLHEFEIEYEGWDLNQSLLEEARQRYGGDQVQFKRLNIIDTVMEMKQQAKPDKTFDLVVMFGVTHHIPSEGL